MRLDERDISHLWDIVEAAREAAAFVSGMRFHEYERDRMVQAAVERKLEIMGEAAKRVSEDFRNAHDEIPWRGMIGQRNVLAHEYGEVKQERLWIVVTDRLPDLLRLVSPLVPEPPESSSGA